MFEEPNWEIPAYDCSTVPLHLSSKREKKRQRSISDDYSQLESVQPPCKSKRYETERVDNIERPPATSLVKSVDSGLRQDGSYNGQQNENRSKCKNKYKNFKKVIVQEEDEHIDVNVERDRLKTNKSSALEASWQNIERDRVKSSKSSAREASQQNIERDSVKSTYNSLSNEPTVCQAVSVTKLASNEKLIKSRAKNPPEGVRNPSCEGRNKNPHKGVRNPSCEGRSKNAPEGVTNPSCEGRSKNAPVGVRNETSVASQAAETKLMSSKRKSNLSKVDKLRGIINSLSNGSASDVSQAKRVGEAVAGDKANNAPLLSSDTNLEAVPLVNGKKKKESLRERMMKELSTSRFRAINEELYTSPSDHAVAMFKSDRESFDIYHHGYQSQVSKWPINPVDKMIEFIRKCGTKPVVVDFGCGEAKIAHSLPNIVHSFDLVALNNRVTVADMSHVPLKSSSADIAVFCLSLMGTNLVQFLCEANRVLKPGATLLIAEVVSRFEKVGSFVRKVEKLGYKLNTKDTTASKMFLWFEFKKVHSPPELCRRPELELKACVSKKR